MFFIISFTKYYYDVRTKEDEIDGTCRMHKITEKNHTTCLTIGWKETTQDMRRDY
jgi:hypothetical protein